MIQRSSQLLIDRDGVTSDVLTVMEKRRLGRHPKA